MRKPLIVPVAVITATGMAFPPVSQADPTAGQPERVCANKMLLHEGTTALRVERIDDSFTLKLQDETSHYHPETQMREVEDVVIGIKDNSYLERTEMELGDSNLDFLGPVGGRFYKMSDGTGGRVHVEFDTTALDFAQHNNKVTTHLDPVSMPTDTSFGIYLYISSRVEREVLVDSLRSDYSFDTKKPDQNSFAWGFSKPGVYTFDAYYSAGTPTGGKIQSPKKRLTIVVGDEYFNRCKQVALPESEANNPVPTETTQPNFNTDTINPSQPDTPKAKDKSSSQALAKIFGVLGGALTTVWEFIRKVFA
ncbi:hypothetical protein CMUST_05305 [Corynebacterium mustelae]|uniref:Actinobacterial surface-anchored protein domain n=1 Tax=Corynebacterium mustelae TaxID=571915 RepID=A0A0G3GW63_9CORY|nr:choice-of-anchor M domain-containing protein [Corynebacterium mustelae]AKK05399.1 hypothetical protein CMUST_05305 [Corynebacterium mustelae]